MTRADKLLIIGLIVFSLVGVIIGNLPGAAREAQTAVIKVQGQVVDTVDLMVPRDNHKITVKGPRGVSVLQVEEGKVKMFSSPCPDKICISQGWAEKPGDCIVCVPNQISVSIEGDGNLDAIIR